jgi:hypothetical protein
LFLAALASVGVGAWVLATEPHRDAVRLSAEANDDGLLQTAIGLLISVGTLVALIVGLACCGAVQGSRGKLRVFIFFMIILCIIELICLAMVARFKNTSTPEPQASLAASLTPENYEGKMGELMDSVQQDMHCCGSNNFTDYDRNGFPGARNNTDFFYPYSCCVLLERQRRPGVEDVLNLEECEGKNPDYFISKGCGAPLNETVHHVSAIILIVGLVTLCLQMLSIVMAACLWRAITKEDYY